MFAEDRFHKMAAFLANSATHDGAETIRIDTHTAAVILAGDYAWKLRRPVNYGWLDYSTVQKRRVAAERELHDNSRGAPGLYLGLGGMSDRSGQLTLLGPTAARGQERQDIPADAEPIVVMNRFAQEDLFDQMVADGRLDQQLMHETGKSVADMHRAAPACGQASRLPAFATKEVNDLTALADILDAGLIGQVAPLIKQRAAELAALASRRGARRCHGDLHLRNIVLWRGRPCPFDCIDFNDAFTDIDPLYDLAFLLMDLDFRGHAELGTTCLNAWLERMCADPEPRTEIAFDGLALLEFYKACRAAIRGKVSGMAARTAHGPIRQREIQEANLYLELALGLLRRRPRPRLIAVGGLSGTGKSTLARRIAERLGAVILRSDAIRKGLWAMGEAERLPTGAYAADVSLTVYEDMLGRAARALQGGMPVILDAAHLRQSEREQAGRLALTHKVPFLGIWLEASSKTLQDRVAARQGDVSDADATVVAIQSGYDLGQIDWVRLPAGGDRETVAKDALALVCLRR